MKKLILWLLQNQYVVSRRLPGRMWVVRKGSGMGLHHSSAVADSAFLVLADLWATKLSTCSGFGIQLYCRFRDDIFVVATSFPNMRRFAMCLRSRAARVYKLEAVVSRTAVDMCAVNVSVRNSSFICVPKSGKKAGPLGVDSSHPPAVHTRWPPAYARSLMALCTTSADAAHHQNLFVQHLCDFGDPDWRVKLTGSVVGAPSPPTQRPSRSGAWLVLNWHRDFDVRRWSSVVQELMAKPMFRTMLTSAFDDAKPRYRVEHLGLSWRVCEPKMQAVLNL